MCIFILSLEFITLIFDWINSYPDKSILKLCESFLDVQNRGKRFSRLELKFIYLQLTAASSKVDKMFLQLVTGYKGLTFMPYMRHMVWQNMRLNYCLLPVLVQAFSSEQLLALLLINSCFSFPFLWNYHL